MGIAGIYDPTDTIGEDIIWNGIATVPWQSIINVTVFVWHQTHENGTGVLCYRIARKRIVTTCEEPVKVLIRNVREDCMGKRERNGEYAFRIKVLQAVIVERQTLLISKRQRYSTQAMQLRVRSNFADHRMMNKGPGYFGPLLQNIMPLQVNQVSTAQFRAQGCGWCAFTARRRHFGIRPAAASQINTNLTRQVYRCAGILDPSHPPPA